MTDNEIIKALENEVKSTEYVDSDYCDGVDLTLIKSAVDLINRQQAQLADERAKIEICAETISRQDADIKRLKKDKYKLQKALNQSEDYRVMAKSEAIKEFAERLKEKALPKCDWDNCVDVEDIDNLVKELAGDTE